MSTTTLYKDVPDNDLRSLSRQALKEPFVDDLGGGDGYDPDAHSKVSSRTTLGRVTPETADRIVSNETDLRAALTDLNGNGSANNPREIFVDADRIEVTQSNLTVGPWVTLAGGRGMADYPTCTIECKKPDPQFRLLRGGRVSSFRLYGDEPDWFDPIEKLREMGYSEEEIKSIGGKFIYRIGTSKGIHVVGENAEVDNMAIGGFVHAGVSVQIPSSPIGYANGSPYIHHCDICDCPAESLGYGVVVRSGGPFIERCFMDNNRHSVAATGDPESSWVTDGSVYGPTHYSHVLDMHGQRQSSSRGYDLSTLPRLEGVEGVGWVASAGGEVGVYNSTILSPTNTSIKIRGVPITGVTLDGMHTLNTRTVSGLGGVGLPYNLVAGELTPVQAGLSAKNLYQGRDDPTSTIGVPLKGVTEPEPEPPTELLERIADLEREAAANREEIERILPAAEAAEDLANSLRYLLGRDTAAALSEAVDNQPEQDEPNE